MKIIELVDYDNFRRYSLDLDSKCIKKQPGNWQPKGWPPPGSVARAEMPNRGVLKRFTFGGEIICFHMDSSDKEYLYRNGNIEKIDLGLSIEYKPVFILTFGVIYLRSITCYFFDISWKRLFFPVWLSKKTDPTWDYLDEECQHEWRFGRFIKSKIK